jgi:AraC-like DNA-binding protein
MCPLITPSSPPPSPRESPGSPWRGQFVFGETCAAYRGAASENARHAHAAIQIALSGETPVCVETDLGRMSGNAIVIRPMVAHALVASGPVVLVYVEARSALARALLECVGSAGVELLPENLLTELSFDESPDAWLGRFSAKLRPPLRELDPRLASALDRLATKSGAITVADATAESGLSGSRLRTLAREQLGVSIATWLVWRKLERAARELTTGASLAQSAIAGGFSDQAHFARAMRRMFGVTPRVASRTLR